MKIYLNILLSITIYLIILLIGFSFTLASQFIESNDEIYIILLILFIGHLPSFVLVKMKSFFIFPFANIFIHCILIATLCYLGYSFYTAKLLFIDKIREEGLQIIIFSIFGILFLHIFYIVRLVKAKLTEKRTT